MGALLLQRADDPFHHAVLLRAMRRDEFLLQAIAARQGGVFPARENQAVIAAQKERLLYLGQRPEASKERLFKGAGRGTGLATMGQLPTQQFTGCGSR